MKWIIVASMVVNTLYSQPQIQWKKIVEYGTTKEEAIARAHDKSVIEALFGWFEYRFRCGIIGGKDFDKVDVEFVFKNEVCIKVNRNKWKCTLYAKVKPKK
jgi:hypothetical protein